LPRQPDPKLEQRILDAASRLWARGGEKALTMRAVAKAASTTTPTVYERYRDRDDILRAIRLEARRQLFASVSQARTVRQSVEQYLRFALSHSYAYEVLFDGERIAERLGGSPRQYTRLMLSIWSLMHGTAMLIIRGRFEGALREQTVNVSVDACEAIIEAAQSKRLAHSGPKWPSNLILGEGKQSRAGDGNCPRSLKGRKSR
jgi:AcrR family transcriptional regulator